ncbi:unnamed protein product [marine sediment metagenome]|uniref:Uncharacterized protein n=1 Tax=marine sediment metagenome TaxID=412755 RepID=X0VEM9_9ZZZZ
MKIRMLSPEHGDQILELTAVEATDLILEEREAGRVGFVKFGDGQVLEMMERTGILQQLEQKEQNGVMATVIPHIAGG